MAEDKQEAKDRDQEKKWSNDAGRERNPQKNDGK